MTRRHRRVARQRRRTSEDRDINFATKRRRRDATRDLPDRRTYRLQNTELDPGDCPNGSQFMASPGGRPGCCGSQGFDLDAYNCDGDDDDSANVYIRLDQAQEDECVNYMVDYHF